MATQTGKSSKAAPKKTKEPDAIAMLKQDHREAEDLFEQFKKARTEKRKAEIVAKVCEALKLHMRLEEEIFYPAARGEVEDDLLDEAEVEHASAKALIAELEGMEPDDRLYEAKVTVLSEYIEHHVKEEEKEVFPQARKSDMDLDAIAREMEALKEEAGARN
jgi:hemerythrin-like domain-containing protein